MNKKREHPFSIMLGNTVVDTFKNIQRSNLMSFASVVSIVLTLLVLGALITISINITNVADNLVDSLQLKVFLNNNISESDLEDLEESFENNSNITGYIYESNDEALEKYAERLEDYAILLSGFTEGNNPVSNSYTVQVNDPTNLELVKNELEDEGLIAINYIKYGDNYLEAITLFDRLSNIICLGIIAILSIVSVIVIYNTIKLTCYSNRKEIEIMQFIGAESWYIKLPFFFEGLLLGLIAAISATLILALIYTFVIGMADNLAYLPLNTKLVSPSVVIIPIFIFSSAYGIIIGAFGSLFSIRRFFA